LTAACVRCSLDARQRTLHQAPTPPAEAERAEEKEEKEEESERKAAVEAEAEGVFVGFRGWGVGLWV